MFKNYQDIFDERGNNYHRAMIEYPLARKEEFDHVVELSEINDGQVICDIPSGGGYLNQFIDNQVKIISVETSQQFIKNLKSQKNHISVFWQDMSHIPLDTESIDRTISLAGLHHLENKNIFYQEVYRILKKGGIFCLADVKDKSGVAKFLNIFVDQNSSMGHQGDFLNDSTKYELEASNFTILYDSTIEFYWKFNTQKNMVDFCKLLFGIDQATDLQILEGIEQYLGYKIIEEKYYMNWELYFLKLLKVIPDGSHLS